MTTLPLVWVGGCMGALGESDDGMSAAGTPRAQQVEPSVTRRVGLKILVLSSPERDAAGEPVRDEKGVRRITPAQAFVDALKESQVPFEEIKLWESGRPKLTEAFLLGASSSSSVRHARFQAVVVQNGAPELSAAERDALGKFEKEFDIRQVDAYAWPSPLKGFSSSVPARGAEAAVPFEGGSVDGQVARVTEEARRDAFSYLAGSFTFEDRSPEPESAAYFAQALPTSTPVVQVTIPQGVSGAGTSATLVGIHEDVEGREELVLTVALNANQWAHQLLFPGILRWMTRGVHLGTERNYLSVHIDDVFQENKRWKAKSDDDRILMKPADVDFLVAWQTQQRQLGTPMALDIVYNGGVYDRALRGEELRSGPKVALGAELIRQKDALRWLNHTYTHEYLGCERNPPADGTWTCQRDADGEIKWVSSKTVQTQIEANIQFARDHGLRIDDKELVTGEHGGLVLKQRRQEEPSDNPNLLANLGGIAFLGSDASREPEQRELCVGLSPRPCSTLTVPRHPMNIYYDSGTVADEVDQFNTMHPRTGAPWTWKEIVEHEVRVVIDHMLRNDPRPHYVHQPNLTEDRVLYDVLDGALTQYRATFAPSAAPVNPTMSAAGVELQRRRAWSSIESQVEAYVEDGTSLVVRAPRGAYVPLTVPEAAQAAKLEPWGGQRTGWHELEGEGSSTLTLSRSR